MHRSWQREHFHSLSCFGRGHASELNRRRHTDCAPPPYPTLFPSSHQFVRRKRTRGEQHPFPPQTQAHTTYHRRHQQISGSRTIGFPLRPQTVKFNYAGPKSNRNRLSNFFAKLGGQARVVHFSGDPGSRERWHSLASGLNLGRVEQRSSAYVALTKQIGTHINTHAARYIERD